MSIVQQLRDINRDAGDFAAGILSEDISKENQIAFAHRLVDIAMAIKERTESSAGLLVEGGLRRLDDDSRGGGA